MNLLDRPGQFPLHRPLIVQFLNEVRGSQVRSIKHLKSHAPPFGQPFRRQRQSMFVNLFPGDQNRRPALRQLIGNLLFFEFVGNFAGVFRGKIAEQNLVIRTGVPEDERSEPYPGHQKDGD